MVSAADIITYIGVPLAILGVAPILYSSLKTLVMSFRLHRTLKTYDIEASVQSRLLSGILDVNVPTYELTLPPRDSEQYWSFKTTDGSRHGASWQNINWLRRPIDEKMFQVHFSDRIKLPEASVNFADLIHYLGDLGLQTNPEGFWGLAQKGLNVLPGTCLVRETGEDGVEKPILVVAKKTIEHPGTLLLQFLNKPSKTREKDRGPGPDWIRVPAFPATTEPAESKDTSGVESVQFPGTHEANETPQNTQHSVDEEELKELQQEIVEYVHISRKGIVEKILTTGVKLPVVGLPFWFVYSMLASTARDGHCEYNGRPFGFRIRLSILYFSREAYVYNSGFDWTDFTCQLLSPSRIHAIPEEWTEDSSARRNVHLTKRFELLVDSKLRNRAAELRRSRQEAFQTFFSTSGRMRPENLPLEIYDVPTAVWTEAAQKCESNILPLTSDQVPTSQEICIAATSNSDLAMQIDTRLKKFLWWLDGEGERPTEAEVMWLPPAYDSYEEVIQMCAIIILQSIAEGAPYLASLGDVEECVTKWDPVYLC